MKFIKGFNNFEKFLIAVLVASFVALGYFATQPKTAVKQEHSQETEKIETENKSTEKSEKPEHETEIPAKVNPPH